MGSQGRQNKDDLPPRNYYIEKEIEIPGYIIEATIDLPNYHPHTIWWLAYISYLLKGGSFNELIENPPWPVPKDHIITSYLVMEMIDYGWLIPDWESGDVNVSLEIREIYEKKGEIGLARNYLSYKTVNGRWWIDGFQGIPIEIQTIQSYDLDFGKTQKEKTIVLESNITPDDLLEQLNFDLSILVRMIDALKGIYGYKQSYAFLSSPFQIIGKKNIRLKMYGNQSKTQWILPNKLENLEPLLWSECPELFGEKRRRKKRLFKWRRSPIEKFALTLEKFPDHLVMVSKSKYYENLGKKLIEELKQKDEWIRWYDEGLELIPIAGYSSLFFDYLRDIFGGITKFDKFNKKPDIVLICSAFLNSRNLYEDIGFIDALNYASRNAKIIIIYGHSNDDNPAQQQKDIKDYYSKLCTYAPSYKDNIIIISAKKRSHEKVVLSSEGHWFIGSWNPCSSNPDSTMFEVGILGKSYKFALNILNSIKKNIEDYRVNKFIQNLENNLNKNINIRQQNNIISVKELYRRLYYYSEMFNRLLINLETQEKYKEILDKIRLYLAPFLKKARVRLVNEHLSRDVLVSQIHSSYQDIFIASDRISGSALDKAMLHEISRPSIEGKRYLRILWGREWEKEQNIPEEARLQIKNAKKVIKEALKILDNQLKTSLMSMENHAKFALFDGARGLITSENLLSYGGEKTKYESRELGIFVESIPVIREIEGYAKYHRLPLLEADQTANEMAKRPYEWITIITDIYHSYRDFSEEINYDYSKLKYLNSALELKHTDFNNAETSEFDRQLLKDRWDIYLSHKNGNNLNIQKLWLYGIKYYLLLPTLNESWRPYSYELKLEDFNDPSIPPINLEDKNKSLNSSEIKEKPTFYNARPISTPESSTLAQSNTKYTKIHPIIREIMDDMILIPAGTFLMGDSKSKKDRPVHKVIISQPFYMSKFMVTQELWEKIMNELPYIKNKMKSPKFPITNINYYQVIKFIKKLNSLPGGGLFDLPTDAQWEYACRAGTNSAYFFGNDEKLLNEYAWSKINSNGRLHAVGLLKSNNWGLYDMLGLEFEFVKDGYRKYTSKPIIDPIGELDEPEVICRGGHWGRYPFPKSFDEHYFRCGVRYLGVPKDDVSNRVSFRLIRKIPKNTNEK
ncbi:MAG: SUMF1/EgtB/PvdO family nonheme iron enzyme [Promethearchaeota archaeon]